VDTGQHVAEGEGTLKGALIILFRDARKLPHLAALIENRRCNTRSKGQRDMDRGAS